MPYIKITGTTYGYRKPGSGMTVAVTPKDPPIEVTEAEAERLVVKHKVAEYAEAAIEENIPDSGGGQQPYNKEIKLAELQEIAKTYGVENASTMRTKDMVIAAIEAAKSAAAANDNDELPEDDGEGGNDDEPPPNLGTADPEGAEI